MNRQIVIALALLSAVLVGFTYSSPGDNGFDEGEVVSHLHMNDIDEALDALETDVDFLAADSLNFLDAGSINTLAKINAILISETIADGAHTADQVGAVTNTEVCQGNGTTVECDIGSLAALNTAISSGLVTGAHTTIPKHSFCETIYAPTVFIANDNDIPSIWRAPAAITITEVWCESDETATTIQLQKDDGTATNMLSANEACDGGATTGFVSGENSLADGDRLDYLTVAISNSPTRVTVCVEYTFD